MQQCTPNSDSILVNSDLVYETVFSATVTGKSLDEMIVAGVMKQIDCAVMNKSDVTWKVSYRNETTATEGNRQIAEVIIVVDHRREGAAEASLIQPKPGDMVAVPAGFHWMDVSFSDGRAIMLVKDDVSARPFVRPCPG